MDPRLQPNQGAASALPMQDVKPAQPAPVAAAQPAAPAPNPIQTPEVAGYEIADSIPMAAQPGQAAAPAPAQAQAAANPDQEPHDELDKILQAVNNRVQAPLNPPKSGNKILSKVAAGAAKAKKAKQPSAAGGKPVVPMAIVIIVALSLSAVAFMAYRQSGKAGILANQPGRVGTSSDSADAIQSAGGTLVRPADLDDYSQTLSQQLNGLNDKGDFDSNSLSDQILGL